jgi:hypothetical protein
MTIRGKAFLGILAAAGMLAACAPPQPPKLDVQEQWSEAVNNLGLFAVYPPSEDVMVGDAFLYLPDATFFRLVRVTAAPLTPLARQFCYQEQDRLAMDTRTGGTPGVVKKANDAMACRADPTARGVGGVAAKWHVPQQVAPHNVAEINKGHATRLREAAIPRLEVGRFSEGELAGAGLLGDFGAALGLGASAKSAMRVELQDLQSATLDELRGSRLLEDIAISRVRRVRDRSEDYPNALTPLMLLRSMRYADQRNGTNLSGQFCRGDFRALDDRGVRIVVANRVMYAGKVIFDFLSERVLTARLGLEFASVLAGMPQKPVVPPLPGAPAAGNPPPDPKESTLQVQLAAMLATATRVMTLDADKPGQASARLTTGSFGSLAMEKTFVRPAAVGMGAALHVPIAEAMLPAGPDQVREAALYCEEVHGVAAPAMQEQLWRNYRWAFYLHLRDDEGPRKGLAPNIAWDMARAELVRLRGETAVAAAEAMPKDPLRTGRLPPLPANEPVRVRP